MPWQRTYFALIFSHIVRVLMTTTVVKQQTSLNSSLNGPGKGIRDILYKLHVCEM
jgi:hypothetical protein